MQVGSYFINIVSVFTYVKNDILFYFIFYFFFFWKIGISGIEGDYVWTETWRKVIDINLSGTIATVMPIYERMKRRNSGQICSML
jgi:NAD(P)-dependent dehydrogenase (short-subunit alcohol dehydrogenase family)